MNSKKSALVLGASGLIGGHCLKLLLEDPVYGRVVVLVRRDLPVTHPKLEQYVANFSNLESAKAHFQVNDVFCCLGTTIKKVGSQEAFRQVDYELPLTSAKIASEMGAEKFLVVSSLGADEKLPVFYSRVKGEMEKAIQQFPFKGIFILRPSLLLGNRNEFRLGELVAQKLTPFFSFLLSGVLKKYRPIHAKTVAKAMVMLAKGNKVGTVILESNEIEEQV